MFQGWGGMLLPNNYILKLIIIIARLESRFWQKIALWFWTIGFGWSGILGGMNWYILHVKPHKERPTNQLLLERAVETFLPLAKVKPKNPRAAKERPYFPGYLFLHADLEQLGHNAFSWIPGTRGLVSFGGVPAVVPDSLVSELKTQLATLEAISEVPFKHGETVRITGGLFAGYEAIFDYQLSGSERVQVLLAFLSNYPQRIKLDINQIEKK